MVAAVESRDRSIRGFPDESLTVLNQHLSAANREVLGLIPPSERVVRLQMEKSALRVEFGRR